jgi:hypothetical protein
MFSALAEYPRPEVGDNGMKYYRKSEYPVDRFVKGLTDDELLQHMGVPLRFHTHALAMYEDPFRDEIQNWLNRMPYVFRPFRKFRDEDPDLCGVGLVLWGEGGARKTTTAAAILLRLVRMGIPNTNPLPKPGGGRTYHGQAMGRFLSWQYVMETFRQGFGDDDIAEDAQILRDVMYSSASRQDSADFLVLDDVSRERTTEWNIGELQRVLRWRHEHGYPTILTTNHSPGLWKRHYGKVMSVFMERAFIDVRF